MLQVVLYANGARQAGRLTADVRVARGRAAYLVNTGAVKLVKRCRNCYNRRS
jgi:hypothetical protein